MFEYLKECEDKRARGGLQDYIGKYLYNFIVVNGIQTVIETGVSWGFASCYFLEAVAKTDGTLMSIENRLMAKEQMVVPEELYSRWGIYERSSKIELPKVIDSLAQVDLFWHDSDHSYTNQLFEYRTAKLKARFIGSHDIHRRDRCAWDTFKNETEHRLITEDDQFGLLEVLI